MEPGRNRIERMGISERTYLTVGEMRQATGLREPTDQMRWLLDRGIAFAPNRYGFPLVARSALRGFLPAYGEDEPDDVKARIQQIARLFSAPPTWFVYLVDENEDASPVKVGTGGETRIYELQIGNPRRLRMLTIQRGPRELERFIHRTLKPYSISGEWFARSPKVAEFVASAQKFGYRAALEQYARFPGP